MTDSSQTDKTSYAPFILIDTDKYKSLVLSDKDMEAKFHIFEERADEGWSGNGYDWTSLAEVVIAEQLPDLKNELSFDPEAGMFSASGSRPALERLGKAMSRIFKDDEVIRDLLSRAELG